jgi:hypothetical protein
MKPGKFLEMRFNRILSVQQSDETRQMFMKMHLNVILIHVDKFLFVENIRTVFLPCLALYPFPLS